MNTFKILIFHVLLLANTSLFAYRLTGKVENLKDNAVFLYDNFENRFIDTAKVTEGAFVFEGKVKFPVYVSVYTSMPLHYFFLENSEISFTGDVKDSHSFKVLGSKSEDEWARVMMMWDKYKEKITTTDKIQKQAAYFPFFQDYVQANPSSAVTGLLLFQFANTVLSSEQKGLLWNMLSKEGQKNQYARSFHAVLAIEKKFIGEKIKIGKLKDISGKEISLENYKGNYVLLDFWASWCKPCRSENAALLPVYQQFHTTGFEIIAISWDRDSLLLQEAIQKDNIAWKVIWHKDAKAAPLSQKYEIPYIPFNLLIDKKGRIVGKNVSMEELKEYLIH